MLKTLFYGTYLAIFSSEVLLAFYSMDCCAPTIGQKGFDDVVLTYYPD
jgi:hypothetical protein